MNNTKRIYFNIFIIFSFLLIAVMSNILLLHLHVLFDASDMQFHFKRINELLMEYHHNVLGSFAFNQFNGSAVMYFYPYINLLPIIIIMHFVTSRITVIYLFFIFTNFISLLISFYSCNSVSGSYKISYIFSVIYSTSSIIFGYEYIFMDIGVVSAMSFLPMAIFGFIDLLHGEFNYLKFSIGVTLIAYCHVLSLVILLLFIIVWLFINYKTWNKNLLINVIKSMFLFCILSSFIWLPAIYLFIFNKIKSPLPVKLFGLPNRSFYTSLFSLPDPIGIGIFPILAIFISLLSWSKFTYLDKQMYIISVVSIFICSKIFPWNLIPNSISLFLSYFQSTYRFLIIPIVLLNYLFALVFTKFISNKHVKCICIISILLCALGLRLFTQQYFIHSHINAPTFSSINYNKGDTTYYSINYKMKNSHQIQELVNSRPNGMNSDYYPLNSVKDLNNIDHSMILSSDNHKLKLNHAGYNMFHFKNNITDSRLIMPLLYYNRENIKLYLDGNRIHYSISKHNLITINDIKKGSHRLYVVYKPTKILRYSLLLCYIGLFWMFLCLLYKRII